MTTDRQPPTEEPSPRRRTTSLRIAAVVVVAILVALAAWLFTLGPLSRSAQQERQVGQTLDAMSAATSFAEFNDHLCAENRVPQDLVDTISSSGTQTGADLDALFRDSIASSFPEDLRVTGVEFDDGSEATATVESGADGSGPEQLRMRKEDGDWKVCEPGVGMGAVPQDGQPG